MSVSIGLSINPLAKMIMNGPAATSATGKTQPTPTQANIPINPTPVWNFLLCIKKSIAEDATPTAFSQNFFFSPSMSPLRSLLRSSPNLESTSVGPPPSSILSSVTSVPSGKVRGIGPLGTVLGWEASGVPADVIWMLRS
ncbi:hypothetical protein M3P05_11605 [Sansalvadorimonas sp. 2012CJ34-2]|uniref:Uncharacterized protein n=1 Tax=Parendozoicomonas callyspongiae TaxID=2942213 RepID=A0ABT0PGT6_9GAMM|nr:hypothetical protein [Sansalvadorimonas sp. 2012CJ34-2]MCL6270569.1 hypothetical protein [Sansalvadorimonas sp. 2012CJ34-2]